MIQEKRNSERKMADANDMVADVAYRASEVIAIYPITPSSGMAESCDEWSARGRPNLWGQTPTVCQMQSEGGAAGALHGALSAGAMSTSFMASQGLLLMIPNMYKIAGELTPFVLHVTARALATHGLSIFGDHSDVMSCRQTGFGMLASGSVQEAGDMAAIAHAATLKSRIPFMHFFDGFRTSHEMNSVEAITDAQLRELLEEEAWRSFERGGMNPERPEIRGTAQNPDVFFQGREAGNRLYDACPTVVQEVMDRFGEISGRHYKLYEYSGHPEAEAVAVVMGSAGETLEETSRWLNGRKTKTGVLRVRLYRPLDAATLIRALPPTVKTLAVLDRTKEPGSGGEPLYLDVVGAVHRHADHFAVLPRVVGGRYGLGSKEFSPGMAKAVLEHAQAGKLAHDFTVGIRDDVTHRSIEYDADFNLVRPGLFEAVFYGLGSDGTVGANKNTIKIIGEAKSCHAQAYFVYDSKKSGAVTISHLRFGPECIRAPYLVRSASFVGCHQFSLLEQYPVLESAAPGATLLLNSTCTDGSLWNRLSRATLETIREKHLQVYAIDAYRVAREAGMGGRINTIMQTCFFAISGVMPKDQAIKAIKQAIQDTYGKKGEAIVRRNWAAVDAALGHLKELGTPPDSAEGRAPVVRLPENAPDFVRHVTAAMMEGRGEELPVSALPLDGRWPTDTAKWEKRRIAQEIPIWDPSCCIQCNKCVETCPHATIRSKFYDASALEGAPEGFISVAFRDRKIPDKQFSIQVAPEDCTGCGLCVQVCPAKNRSEPRFKAINMKPAEDHMEAEMMNWEFFLELPQPDPAILEDTPKLAQFRQPLFEFSGACAGCGETPYVKLLTQLFGDRLLIANATGCSSIYGGNLPTTPYSRNAEGRGPTWSNSLFEDNAEYGLGIRLGVDQKEAAARLLLERLRGVVDAELVDETLRAPQKTDGEIAAQRDRVRRIGEQIAGKTTPDAERLKDLLDYLVEKAVWIVGGDGWAYDIGYGGLDHVLSTGRNVKVLVLDTEVYSNTGGQQSKSTPLGAIAKFASSGKAVSKKNLGLLAMEYGHVYIGQISMGGNSAQALRILREANDHPGPALVIAYSHCIAHGYNLTHGMDQQKLAVKTGYWPLFHYDPQKAAAGEPGLVLDSRAPSLPVSEYMKQEGRFQMLALSDPERFKMLSRQADAAVKERYRHFEYLAGYAEAPAKTENTE